MGTRVDLSTMELMAGEGTQLLTQLGARIRHHCYRPGVLLHRTTPPEMVEEAHGLGWPLTVEAPLGADFAINLAAENQPETWEALEQTVQTARQLGARTIIFNGFFLAESAIPNDPDRFAALGGHGGGEEEPERGFFRTREYHLLKERVKVNMRRLRRQYPDLTFCLKNDFPVPGTGAHRPEDLNFLECDLWIDVGHLWAAALVYRFDFYRGLEYVLESTRVRGVTLHTNPMPLNAQHFHIHEGHEHLYRESDMSLGKILYHCRAHRVQHYALEIKGLQRKDVNLFLKLHGQESRESESRRLQRRSP